MPPVQADVRKRVLVVDDDDDIRESLMGYLEDRGFEPVGAGNGKRALDLLNDGQPRPQLIVLDLMMPVMDGRAFREAQLRVADIAEIPVVLVSAYADLADVARELKIADYRSKPIEPEDFLDLVSARCG